MATATNTSSLNVVYRRQRAVQPDPSIHPLLELAVGQTNGQGAYLYHLVRDSAGLELVAWTGRPASEMESFDVELRLEAAEWHRGSHAAVFLDGDAWSDWRYERFPEFVRNRFEAVASVPVVDRGELVGLVNVCRIAAAGWQPGEAAFLRSLSLPLGGLLGHSSARVRLESEVETLARKLADRKLFDRAKGLLQVSNQWSEEQAYLHLRRTSRQRRTAMRNIAREIIEVSGGVR